MGYDKIIEKAEMRYGILCGGEKIVFIKVGSEGDIYGYKDKYLKIAHNLHARLGATVICSSNPCDLPCSEQIPTDKAMIAAVASEAGFSAYEVYLFGTSDGAYHNLCFAKELPTATKLLCINLSFITRRDLEIRLSELPRVQKILVYGDKDDDYSCIDELRDLKIDALEILTVRGADHEFHGMLDEYIAQADLL